MTSKIDHKETPQYPYLTLPDQKVCKDLMRKIGYEEIRLNEQLSNSKYFKLDEVEPALENLQQLQKPDALAKIITVVNQFLKQFAENKSLAANSRFETCYPTLPHMIIDRSNTHLILVFFEIFKSKVNCANGTMIQMTFDLRVKNAIGMKQVKNITTRYD